MAQVAEQPAATTPRIGKQGDPCVMVIFGAAGDLTGRKLIPALYNLARAGLLSREFAVVGVARSQMSNDDFRKKVAQHVKEFCTDAPDDDLWEWFARRFFYVACDFNEDRLYPELKDFLAKVDRDHSTHQNFFFYLATAPRYFGDIVEKLAAAGLMEQGNDHWRRVIIEKPFGHDLESAKALNQQVLKVADEKQIYRIDHYLGKETVQNVMAFRFANGLFEPIWNRNFIDYVQITASEDIGIGTRAGYYDKPGALRALVQNHMLQLLPLVCMEPPVTFSANDVRDEKVKVLHAIHPPDPEKVDEITVRAQYAAGMSGGEEVKGYLEEEGVPPDSSTETYAALRLEVDNWRWAGVPFYLRTGKRLARKVTEIAVTLKPVPHLAFEQDGSVGLQPNELILTMQPNEGVALQLGAKIPGSRMR